MHQRSTDLSGVHGSGRDHLRPGAQGLAAAGGGRNSDPLVARLVEIQKAIESGTQAITTAIRTAAIASGLGEDPLPLNPLPDWRDPLQPMPIWRGPFLPMQAVLQAGARRSDNRTSREDAPHWVDQVGNRRELDESIAARILEALRPKTQSPPTFDFDELFPRPAICRCDDRNGSRRGDCQGGLSTLEIRSPQCGRELIDVFRPWIEEERRRTDPRLRPRIDLLEAQQQSPQPPQQSTPGSAAGSRPVPQESPGRRPPDSGGRAGSRAPKAPADGSTKIKGGDDRPTPAVDGSQGRTPESKPPERGPITKSPKAKGERPHRPGEQTPQNPHSKPAHPKPGAIPPHKSPSKKPKRPAHSHAGPANPGRSKQPAGDKQAAQDRARLFATLKTIADALLEIKTALAAGPRRPPAGDKGGPQLLSISAAANRVAAVGQ